MAKEIIFKHLSVSFQSVLNVIQYKAVEWYKINPSFELSLWDVHKNKLVQSDSQTNDSYKWIILVNFVVISLGIVFSEAFFKIKFFAF